MVTLGVGLLLLILLPLPWSAPALPRDWSSTKSSGLVSSDTQNATMHVRSWIYLKTRTSGTQWLMDPTDYETFRVDLNVTVGHEVYLGWYVTYDYADVTWFTFAYNITSGLDLMKDLDVYPENLTDSAWGPSEKGLMPAALRFSFVPSSEGEICISLMSYTAECLNPYDSPQELISFSSDTPVHEVVIHVRREELQLGPTEFGLIAVAVTVIGSTLFYFHRRRRRSVPNTPRAGP